MTDGARTSQLGGLRCSYGEDNERATLVARQRRALGEAGKCHDFYLRGHHRASTESVGGEDIDGVSFVQERGCRGISEPNRRSNEVSVELRPSC